MAAVALLRAGSCTHSFNSDQRHVALAIVARGPATLTVQAPPNGNVAPPGHYLLFVLNGDGVPSEGRFVRLR
ncbi:MAG: galactose oxidase early set domain-containing protein [Actinomycetota bacterium]|nr:galactose oxidase early set domain-containing protein [Actinomycetota bacterium]